MKLEGVFRPVKLMTRHQEQRGKALFVETSINRDLLTESFSYSGLVTNFYAAAAAVGTSTLLLLFLFMML